MGGNIKSICDCPISNDCTQCPWVNKKNCLGVRLQKSREDKK